MDLMKNSIFTIIEALELPLIYNYNLLDLELI